MRSDLFDAANMETTSTERFVVQNRKMLKVTLGAQTGADQVLALKGSMVAFQGEATFEHKSAGSLGRLMKRVLTSEDTPLMTVTAKSPVAEVFFADNAKDVFLLDLEGDAISVNGTSILAFDMALDYDVKRVQGAGMLAGGMFNTVVHGTGKVALTCAGQPLVLDCSQTPTSVDINAAVCWSANLAPTLRNSVNMRSLVKGGTGEAFQYVFHGPGFVVVQPSENDGGVPPHDHNSGGLGGLLGG